MIKTGIAKLNQLSHDKTFCRKELKNVSITLYDQTLNLVDGDQLAERILLLFSDESGAICLITVDPMKPAPPVTIIFITFYFLLIYIKNILFIGLGTLINI